jgi:hypothetical protein
MNTDEFISNLSKSIFLYTKDNHSLTSEEKQSIYSIIDEDDAKLRDIAAILLCIDESIKRTPINVIQFKNEH